MALSLRPTAAQLLLPGTIRQILLGESTSRPALFRQGGILSRFLPAALPLSIPLQLPTLGSIWESILNAVPKKKTSHSKKRSRFLAGKGLKDVTNLNRCSGCGNIKKAHHLCPYCVREIQDLWKGRGTVEVEEQRRAEKKAAMDGWVTPKERREANRTARR